MKNSSEKLSGWDSKEWMGEKPEIIKPLYGRLAILPSGAHAGDVAFFIQPWYDFDDTPYNTNDGTASGVPFQSKAAWWKSAVKSSIVVRFGHLTNRPRVYAEVAYSASEFGDISYYPGPDLGSQSDGLVELAVVVDDYNRRTASTTPTREPSEADHAEDFPDNFDLDFDRHMESGVTNAHPVVTDTTNATSSAFRRFIPLKGDKVRYAVDDDSASGRRWCYFGDGESLGKCQN